MAKKIRAKENAFDKKYIPKERKEFIDFDYLKKLDPEAKEWLSKFSDEYYGAAFTIRDTYIIENGKYICINDRDLRKYRKETKYYRDKKGNFTTDINYKYSDTNIHKNQEQRNDCNKIANAMSRDYFSKKRKNDNIKRAVKNNDELSTYEYDVELGSEYSYDHMSPEDEWLLKEEMNIFFDALNDAEKEEVLDPSVTKVRKKRLTRKKKSAIIK